MDPMGEKLGQSTGDMIYLCSLLSGASSWGDLKAGDGSIAKR